jgi:4-methyl-5(b-hydroxyethyl)-thiazole monophosphate biosynthesis
MKFLVPVADGFEDIEVMTTVDILRKVGIQIDIVGVPSNVVTSKSGVRIMVDKKIMEMKPEEYDGIILTGGMKNIEVLGRATSLLDLIKKLDSKRKTIAAICAAPLLLAKIGILSDKIATIYPGMERELPKPRDEKVIVDGNIITSQGPGTAVEFALRIIESVKGQAKADQIRRDIIA